MKKIKITALGLLLAIGLYSCKKDGLLATSGDADAMLTGDKIGATHSASNDCYNTYFEGMDQHFYDYDFNGPKYNPTDNYSRDSSFYELSTNYLKCKFSGTLPPVVPHFILPKAVRTPATYYSFLQLFALQGGSGSLCSQGYIDEYKAKVAPLNAIIKRTLDDVGATVYYGATEKQRLTMLYAHVDASEGPLFYSNIHGEPSFAFNYFLCASVLSVVPRVVAVALFDKPDGLPPVPIDPYGVPAPPILVEHWEGFVINHDPVVNVFNDYCAVPVVPTIAYLPMLPSANDYIYYQANYNLLGQFVPHLNTHIFLNSTDHKYYADQNPFSTLVPDGYYDSPSETLGTLHKYYHIINGSVTQILSIIVDPNAPVGP